jgi:lipoprotein-releasing system permease protein
MFHPVAAFIALRYAISGKHNSFVSFINRFSVAGIALGLMSLIIVLSVMNGFEGQLKQKILGIVPQVVAHDANPETIEAINIDSVIGTMPYRETEAIIQSRQALRGVILQGVDAAEMSKFSIVSEAMVAGEFAQLNGTKYRAIISRSLALELDVAVGDTLRVIVAGATIYTPFGQMPSQRLVTISGLFSVGSQFDDKVIFMRLEDVSRLLRTRVEETKDTRLFLNDAFNYLDVEQQLSHQGISSTNWRTRQGPLFDAVKMEKNMMFLMLLLIIAVAAFNIVSALVMVVTEKQGDIAILQTQGMAKSKVMMIFLLNGIINGVKGTAIGLILGLLVVWQINNILPLLGIHLALSADGQGLPIDLQWMQVFWVTIFALGLCFLASLYPAVRALKVQPAQALQHE